MEKIKKVILLGSGALKIGEAGEFDYSGSQALKALKEEKIFTILVNPNIATVQTTKELADKIYFLPVNLYFLEKIIAKERPDGILFSFGGQTALNSALELEEKNIFKKYNLKVLGTPIKSIKITEDRELFKEALEKINVNVPKSKAANNLKEAIKIAKEIGYPVIVRSGYSLGGQGSGIAFSQEELESIVKTALFYSPQVLIEEYLEGWKEIEYEVVRDREDNTLVVCNMENLDPMGVHTGESIVVAPSQTLSDEEYHFLRNISIKVIKELGIIGECNIQFALNPNRKDNEIDYRVIEVNARLSRSSALASKATGYPLAFIACKLSLGYLLKDLQNKVTRITCAFFEPALDYVVVKIPRWDFEKFKFKDPHPLFKIGTSMQSIGEAMGIGRNFEEAFQKALRMVNSSLNGITDSLYELKKKYPDVFNNKTYSKNEILNLIKTPNPDRIFVIVEALKRGINPETISEISHIDKWFIYKIKNIVEIEKEIKKSKKLTKDLLLKAKSFGFSDRQIAHLKNKKESQIEKLRKKYNIFPKINLIDTLAAEYPAKTNYSYLTYKDPVNLNIRKKESKKKKIIVLGSGVYRIGSSVEFDWCAVECVKTLKRLNYETIFVNNNPETVSTDYDISDKLYFEELSLEVIKSIYEIEKPEGVIVSMGGQEANNLVTKLSKNKIKILGTPPSSINIAEDRHLFSRLLQKFNIAQPKWQEFSNIFKIKKFAQEIGYPILIRPSYVLSGTAMNVALDEKELENYLKKATLISKDHPVVISKFITGAKEIEVDGVAKNGDLKIEIISEHIENAGVHSGDATIVIPPQKLYIETINKIKKITKKIVKELKISGPFNIQFLAKENEIMVIECNLRASRSFPFVSKITGINLGKLATLAILGKKVKKYPTPLDLDWVGVKAPQFSFFRIKGADPVLKVEMSSTGEVGCFGENINEAYLKSIIATGIKLPKKSVLLSLGGKRNKIELLEEAKSLFLLGYKIYATYHTAQFLRENNIKVQTLYKIHENKEPNIKTFLEKKKIDLVINITDSLFKKETEDDYIIRRLAIDCNIPLLTDLKATKLFIRSLKKLKSKEIKLQVKAQDEYFK
jgi:carbamoyl-phosphate synthase large subunit